MTLPTTSSSRHEDSAAHVRRAFAFLQELGFGVAHSRPGWVLFGKGPLCVEVDGAQGGWRLALWYCGVRFGIVRVMSAWQPELVPVFDAALSDASAGSIDRLAALVRRHAGRALRGDAQFFWDIEHPDATAESPAPAGREPARHGPF